MTWSPDGTGLLTVGSPTIRIGHTRLLWLPLAGGGPVDLAGLLDRNVMPGGAEWPGGAPQFTRDGHAVLFCGRDRGSTYLYRVDVRGGAPERIGVESAASVAGLSVARTRGVAAIVAVTGSSYGEVALVDLESGEVRELTRHTRAALPEVEFIEPQEREFTVHDGTVVHGWIVRDPASAGAGPLLLDVHGGPHLAWGPHLEVAHPYHQLLAAQGWTVLLLNPRASDGYGEQFYSASPGRWGIGDEPDFLGPLDQLVAEGLADPDRLAVCGYSYGGFSTCRLTTRTDRFAAAVAGGPVTDLFSMAGSSDQRRIFVSLEFVDACEPNRECSGDACEPNRECSGDACEPNRECSGGNIYGSRELLREQSPIERVAQVRTPTLLVHAVDDNRCPVGQSEAWFTALRTLGVTVELVLYPDESHQFLADGRPANRIDYSRQIMRWVTAHASGQDSSG